MKERKLAVVAQDCVACGNCTRYCPKNAIRVDRGLCAVVSEEACIGCGLCEKACPAGVITLVRREHADA